MMKYYLFFISFLFFTIVPLQAKKIKYWKSPNLSIEEPYHQFCIVGFNQSSISDSLLQNWIKAELNEKFNLVKGAILVTSDSNYNYESWMQPIKSLPVDAIITYAIVPYLKEKYTKEPKQYSPILQSPSTNSLWTYYVAQLKRKTHLSQECSTFFIEINIYNQGTYELLWSAKSPAYCSPDILKSTKNYLEKIIQLAVKDEIINHEKD
ncbi:MAG: hypothetical protein LC105_10785 [Chitinophagales bacterium]|nr:hypothetical protein [Chitinophagales bacterium]MCZ2394335.1 hypothetical protein [Chitinophagales bacterium]